MTRAGKKKRTTKRWRYRIIFADGTKGRDTLSGYWPTADSLKKTLRRAYPSCTIVSVREVIKR